MLVQKKLKITKLFSSINKKKNNNKELVQRRLLVDCFK